AGSPLAALTRKFVLAGDWKEVDISEITDIWNKFTENEWGEKETEHPVSSPLNNKITAVIMLSALLIAGCARGPVISDQQAVLLVTTSEKEHWEDKPFMDKRLANIEKTIKELNLPSVERERLSKLLQMQLEMTPEAAEEMIRYSSQPDKIKLVEDAHRLLEEKGLLAKGKRYPVLFGFGGSYGAIAISHPYFGAAIISMKGSCVRAKDKEKFSMPAEVSLATVIAHEGEVHIADYERDPGILPIETERNARLKTYQAVRVLGYSRKVVEDQYRLYRAFVILNDQLEHVANKLKISVDALYYNRVEVKGKELAVVYLYDMSLVRTIIGSPKNLYSIEINVRTEKIDFLFSDGAASNNASSSLTTRDSRHTTKNISSPIGPEKSKYSYVAQVFRNLLSELNQSQPLYKRLISKWIHLTDSISMFIRRVSLRCRIGEKPSDRVNYIEGIQTYSDQEVRDILIFLDDPYSPVRISAAKKLGGVPVDNASRTHGVLDALSIVMWTPNEHNLAREAARKSIRRIQDKYDGYPFPASSPLPAQRRKLTALIMAGFLFMSLVIVPAARAARFYIENNQVMCEVEKGDTFWDISRETGTKLGGQGWKVLFNDPDNQKILRGREHKIGEKYPAKEQIVIIKEGDKFKVPLDDINYPKIGLKPPLSAEGKQAPLTRGVSDFTAAGDAAAGDETSGRQTSHRGPEEKGKPDVGKGAVAGKKGITLMGSVPPAKSDVRPAAITTVDDDGQALDKPAEPVVTDTEEAAGVDKRLLAGQDISTVAQPAGTAEERRNGREDAASQGERRKMADNQAVGLDTPVYFAGVIRDGFTGYGATEDKSAAQQPDAQPGADGKGAAGEDRPTPEAIEAARQAAEAAKKEMGPIVEDFVVASNQPVGSKDDISGILAYAREVNKKLENLEKKGVDTAQYRKILEPIENRLNAVKDRIEKRDNFKRSINARIKALDAVGSLAKLGDKYREISGSIDKSPLLEAAEKRSLKEKLRGAADKQRSILEKKRAEMLNTLGDILIAAGVILAIVALVILARRFVKSGRLSNMLSIIAGLRPRMPKRTDKRPANPVDKEIVPYLINNGDKANRVSDSRQVTQGSVLITKDGAVLIVTKQRTNGGNSIKRDARRWSDDAGQWERPVTINGIGEDDWMMFTPDTVAILVADFFKVCLEEGNSGQDIVLLWEAFTGFTAGLRPSAFFYCQEITPDAFRCIDNKMRQIKLSGNGKNNGFKT
ncbi:MAG: hypothetical protein ABH858_06890, partial [Candidatus Omnitrophota bacterium]